MIDHSPAPPRIEHLRIENYRALRRVTSRDVTPLTVLLGPNGSGKSTVFDVFSERRRPVLVTTHSPFFLNAMRPHEVRVPYRDQDSRLSALVASRGVAEFMEDGAQPGDLWMEGRFNVGDPLVAAGMPAAIARRRYSSPN